METINLYPPPLWKIEYDKCLTSSWYSLVDNIAENAYKVRDRFKNETRSNIGGFQSRSFVWEEFHPEGIKYIENIIDGIIGKSPDVRYTVSNWWFNINGKGDNNMTHDHPGSDLALVWYLTESYGGCIGFQNPHVFKRFNLLNAVSSPHEPAGMTYDFIIEPKKGDVIVFPADVMHFVTPHEQDKDRICISLNISITNTFFDGE